VTAKPTTQFEKPRFEKRDAFLIGGFQAHCSDPPKEIPTLWQRFAPHIGKVPGQVGRVAYGVVLSHSQEGSCEYVAGVEVSDLTKLPSEFARLSVPAHRYAIFAHHEHVSKLGETIDAIWSKWLPGSGVEVAHDPKGTPAFFERYGERFNPQEGKGDVEVWVPVKA
jgi:AraC family transcriptional regulator